MNVKPIKTPKITAKTGSIYDVLDAALPAIEEGSVIAVTSKIVSICEGNVTPRSDIDKEELVVKESNLFLPAALSKYGHHFTITENTLIPMAGVDESNGEGYYILWPKNSQKTANDIRKYLAKKHCLKEIGVIITDSTCQPLRRGSTGIALAHSGFSALNDYIGKPDLFGRPFGVTQSNISGGLAAAAVLAMGEGAEQTPICVLTNLPNVNFLQHDPSREELATTRVILEDDLFAPFLMAVKWHKGDKYQK